MPANKATGVPAFTFRLVFRFYELVCWREIRVPKAITFHQFHWVIQYCMNWDNSHLYDFQFQSRGQKYMVSRPDYYTGGSPFDGALFEPRGGFPVWRDSSEVTLAEVFTRGRKALYTYDYGDNWKIDVWKLESKTPLESSCPLCLAGEGDDPLEDVGGEYGFIQLIKAQNGDEDDYWGGDLEGWEIEPFDLTRTNQRLSKLKKYLAGVDA